MVGSSGLARVGSTIASVAAGSIRGDVQHAPAAALLGVYELAAVLDLDAARRARLREEAREQPAVTALGLDAEAHEHDLLAREDVGPRARPGQHAAVRRCSFERARSARSGARR